MISVNHIYQHYKKEHNIEYNSVLRCKCSICDNEYSLRGIFTHYMNAHTEEGNQRARKTLLRGASAGGRTTKTKIIDAIQKLSDEYYENPNMCPICDGIIPYKIRNNKCCSSSCGGKLANSQRQRSGWTEEQKLRNKERLKKCSMSPTVQRKIVKEAYKNPEGLWMKIFYNNCHCCTKIWTGPSQNKFCSECGHKYSHNGRSKYWFTFNLFHYPDLFDLSLITTIGFRDSKTNPNGITRDHRISVAHAIKYDYDPYYIKHPLNCELMRFDENNKKKTKSSISFDELKRLVDEYDNIIR